MDAWIPIALAFGRPICERLGNETIGPERLFVWADGEHVDVVIAELIQHPWGSQSVNDVIEMMIIRTGEARYRVYGDDLSRLVQIARDRKSVV